MPSDKALEAVAIGIAECMEEGSWDKDRPTFDLDGWRNDCRDFARAALSALRAAGYAVVPVEPTEEMDEAGTDAGWKARQGYGSGGVYAADIYRAMLEAASPSLGSRDEGGVG